MSLYLALLSHSARYREHLSATEHTMNLLQLWTSEHVLASFEDFDVVVGAFAFFEEPYYTLSTALLQPMR